MAFNFSLVLFVLVGMGRGEKVWKGGRLAVLYVGKRRLDAFSPLLQGHSWRLHPFHADYITGD